MYAILSRIEKLLRKYDFILEANKVEAVLVLLKIDPDKAIKRIIQDEWWIGEDAVAEADLGIAGGFMSEARKDQQHFQQLMVQLYEAILQQGYTSDVAKLVTAQFNKWQVSGM